MSDIAKVNSLNDLKELGSFSDVVQVINKEIYPMRVSASSYEELLECVETLRKNWLPFHNGFFINKRKEYIYYLLEHDGEKRENLLGINDKIYSDPKEAKRWYKKMAQVIRADLGDCDNAKKAFHKLQEIYEDLTDDAAFGDADE